MTMMKLMDPKAVVPIDIEGTIFYVKQMTNADKLKMHNNLQNLTVGAGEFEAMMNLCADLVVDIRADGYDFKDGKLVAQPQMLDGNNPDWKEEPRPADGLTVRELVQRMEEIELQKALYKGICDVSSLGLEAEKN